MRRVLLMLVFAAGAACAGDRAGWWGQVEHTMPNYNGKPYVRGASGMKSFDCSGFVWRVLLDNGVLIKRTTARKLYLSLPEARAGGDWLPVTSYFSTICAAAESSRTRSDFFHAGTSTGITCARFDPVWRPKVVGPRRIVVP
jgi:hypothetical protein